MALYGFTLGTGGSVTISTADGAAGVDPYVTLFSGSGGTATFAASNYAHAYFTSGGDFSHEIDAQTPVPEPATAALLAAGLLAVGLRSWRHQHLSSKENS